MTEATRPNILFIVVDDCGYADLGCTGQTDYATPVLDRLAAEGVRFTQAYANASLCTNTRVALMTGRYQYRLPIGLVEPLRWTDRDKPEMGLPPGFPTLPSLLRDAGYATALIGKWHLGYLPHYGPLKSGYDEFFGVMGGFTGYYTHIGDAGEHDFYEGETPLDKHGYVTDLLSDRAAAWVAAKAGGERPYFLSLHYTAPHWPWSAPSVEAAARQREAVRTEITEGGSTRIYGEMMQILDAGIGRVLDAVRRATCRRARHAGAVHQRQWRRALLENLAVCRPQVRPARRRPQGTADLLVAGPHPGRPGDRPGLHHDGPDGHLPRGGRRQGLARIPA